MDFITLGIGFVAGAITGVMGYRWMIKRDSATLEKWAAQAKSAGKSAGF